MLNQFDSLVIAALFTHNAVENSALWFIFAVRGYVTGSTDTSLWTVYSKGSRNYCGNVLPEGMFVVGIYLLFLLESSSILCSLQIPQEW